MSLGFPFRFHPAATSVSLQNRLGALPSTRRPAKALPQRMIGAKPAGQDRAGWALQTERGAALYSGSPSNWGGTGGCQ